MIPVYARVGIGHTIEAAVMGSCHVDGLDEHELLTKASDDSLDYLEMAIPTMSCVEAPTSTPGFGGPGGGPGFGGPMVRPNFGAPSVRPGFGGPGAQAKPPSTTPILDVALKKIAGGVAILRTKAAGTEDTVDITNLTGFMERLDKEYEVVDKLSKEEREEHVKDKGYDVDLLSKVAKDKRLPVPLFAYGGILHPLDVAMVMRLGYNGVIVSKNVFTANNPEKRVRSLVLATIHYKNAKFLAGITEDHGS
ncbi:hypothetical protein IWQ56_001924 [Coemansia nantahalensis]|nr:hypothetical protein IWQ56_001924 [Coemansia nantahalensis]